MTTTAQNGDQACGEIPPVRGEQCANKKHRGEDKQVKNDKGCFLLLERINVSNQELRGRLEIKRR